MRAFDQKDPKNILGWIKESFTESHFLILYCGALKFKGDINALKLIEEVSIKSFHDNIAKQFILQ